MDIEIKYVKDVFEWNGVDIPCIRILSISGLPKHEEITRDHKNYISAGYTDNISFRGSKYTTYDLESDTFVFDQICNYEDTPYEKMKNLSINLYPITIECFEELKVFLKDFKNRFYSHVETIEI